MNGNNSWRIITLTGTIGVAVASGASVPADMTSSPEARMETVRTLVSQGDLKLQVLGDDLKREFRMAQEHNKIDGDRGGRKKEDNERGSGR